MEIVLDRIEQFAEKQGIKIGALEKTIGASKGVLSRAIAQKSDIQSKWLSKLVENFPQIDANWLLTGEGSMYRDTTEQSGTNPPNRDKYIQMLESKIEDQQRIIDLLEDKIESLTRGNANTNIEAVTTGQN